MAGVVKNLLDEFKSITNKTEYWTKDQICEYSSGYFVLNTWISNYSPEVCLMINQTTNKYAHVFMNDKIKTYNLMYACVPKLSNKFIQYPKKKKDEKTTLTEKNLEKCKVLASLLEINKKDVIMLVEKQILNLKEIEL